MQTEIILQTTDLTKTYGSVHALKGVSLAVRRAEVFGFLGPNGAGKTTTISILLGLVHATSGKAEIFGCSISPMHTAPLRRVGALTSSPGFIPYLSGRENLRLLAGMHPDVTSARMSEALALVGLEKAAQRAVKGYSTGMKQRLGLAGALLHRPELLILDEPTNGLDPEGIREVRSLLRALTDQGMTVFLSSHLLHEVEQVCDRVAVLNAGKLVAQGTVDQLVAGKSVVRVRVPSPAQAAEALTGLSGVTAIHPNGHYVDVEGASGEVVVARLVERGIVPGEVVTRQHDLENNFLSLTQENAQEAAMFANLFFAEQTKTFKRALVWVFMALVALIILFNLLGSYNTATRTPAPMANGQISAEFVKQAAEIAKVQITFPGVLIENLGRIRLVAILIVIVLAGAVVAQEFSWHSVHAALSHGVQRWKWLAAKVTGMFVPLGLVVLEVLLIAAVMGGFYTVQQYGGIDLSKVDFLHLAFAAVSVVYALLPYISLITLFAVASRSTILPLGGGMIYFVVELALYMIKSPLARILPIGLSEGLGKLAYGIATGPYALPSSTNLTGQASAPIQLFSPLASALGIAAWTLLLLGIAFAIFQRQDLGE